MSSASSKWEVVIGLEVHAQLMTRTKMFCSCLNQYGGNPNQYICPVCSGQPGSLPVINQRAIFLGVRAAMALECQVHPESEFARKNYFYPDLPKGYQITQYEKPFATKGRIIIRTKVDGQVQEKVIGITRIHFEEDAGKSMHAVGGTLVNLNRAGVPLCEIVSEPDIRSSAEAGAYLRALHAVLKFAEVCDGNMEQGNFRCDANISIRPRGSDVFGTRVELKNLNSFRFVEKAIDHEVARQIALVESGEKVRQQTRGWNAAKGVTEPMREKEEAHDYRYFPEPDLPPLILTPTLLEEVRATMPELPEAKRVRIRDAWGLPDYDASVLTQSKELADYFEKAASASGDGKATANWVLNELLGRLNAAGQGIEQSPVSAENMAALVRCIASGEISGKMAKIVFDDMFAHGKAPKDVIAEKGLVQINDEKALEAIVRQVLAANAAQVAEYRSGKTKLFGFFVGQVMKETKGQGNPATINAILKRLLEEAR
jgi:aspartyl-tRNA(Asn)/glutamyl-tRNA(Gln) amidotransferase subunit B